MALQTQVFTQLFWSFNPEIGSRNSLFDWKIQFCGDFSLIEWFLSETLLFFCC